VPSKIPFKKRHPAVQKFILDSVRKAGSAKGECKRRGDSEYYRELSRKRKVPKEK
jgi:hypothetical protein